MDRSQSAKSEGRRTVIVLLMWQKCIRVRPSRQGDLAATLQVFGFDVRAASLKDILRSKEASSRPQDQQDVIVLREMLKRYES